MWIFLLVLAAVPLIFFWSDSVGTVLPALTEFLPKKTEAHPGDPGTPAGAAAQPQRLGDQGWVQMTDQGYVAWTLSTNGHYRLAVGCRPQAPAALQITLDTGKPLPPSTALQFGSEKLLLAGGANTGPGVTGAAAQFGEAVHLVLLPENAHTGLATVLATFTVPLIDSGKVARALQQSCTE